MLNCLSLCLLLLSIRPVSLQTISVFLQISPEEETLHSVLFEVVEVFRDLVEIVFLQPLVVTLLVRCLVLASAGGGGSGGNSSSISVGLLLILAVLLWVGLQSFFI